MFKKRELKQKKLRYILKLSPEMHAKINLNSAEFFREHCFELFSSMQREIIDRHSVTLLDLACRHSDRIVHITDIIR